MRKLRIETLQLVKISLILCVILISKSSFCQGTVNDNSDILTEQELKYLKKIEIPGQDSIKTNFEGKKVLFTTGDSGLLPISKKEFFDSKVKKVAIVDLSNPNLQNNTEYDLIVVSSINDLKRKVRRRLRNSQKNN